MHDVARSLDILRSRRVRIWGNPGGRTIVFGHGFGWTQEMWRLVAPSFIADHTVVLFDHIGAEGTDAEPYDACRYSSLHGYAADLLELIDALGLEEVVYVGHSASAMIGALAAARRPASFSGLVLLSPSARYVDDVDYRGGFGLEEVRGIVDAIERDPKAWARGMAPVLVADAGKPWVADELVSGFARLDPSVAGQVARALFLGDHRAELVQVAAPALVVQAADDAVVPYEAASDVARRMPRARLLTIGGTGHFTNLTAPAQVSAAISAFLAGLDRR